MHTLYPYLDIFRWVKPTNVIGASLPACFPIFPGKCIATGVRPRHGSALRYCVGAPQTWKSGDPASQCGCFLGGKSAENHCFPMEVKGFM